MKIIKTASGKKALKMSKSEWINLGKKAGWTEGSMKKESSLLSLMLTMEEQKNLEEKYNTLLEKSKDESLNNEERELYAKQALEANKELEDFIQNLRGAYTDLAKSMRDEASGLVNILNKRTEREEKYRNRNGLF